MTYLIIIYAVIRILWESWEKHKADAYVQEQMRLYPEQFSGERCGMRASPFYFSCARCALKRKIRTSCCIFESALFPLHNEKEHPRN